MNAGLVFFLYMSAIGGCALALRRLLGIKSMDGSVVFVGVVMLLFALTFLSWFFNLIYVGAFFIGVYCLAWEVLEEPTETGA